MFGFRDIEILQAIAQAGGFRAAAARSGMSQSAMSTRVAALERRLGVRLFERLGRGVRLSTAGRRLLEESARLIAARDRVVRELAGGEGLRGTVRIGVAETIVHTLLAALLARLREAHPAVRFELTVDTSAALARGLREDGIDVAILLEDAVPGGAEREALAPVAVEWYAGSGRSPEREPFSLEALSRESIVTYSKGTTPYERIERLFAGAGAPPLLHGSASLSTVRHLIASGFGIGILPRRMVESLPDEGDVRLLPVCAAARPEPLRFVVAWLASEGDPTGPIVARAALAADQSDAEQRSLPVADDLLA